MMILLLQKKRFPEDHIFIIVHPSENPRRCTVPIIQKHFPKAFYYYNPFSETFRFPDGTYLLYPEDGAQTIDECKAQIQYICLLDGTWKQVRKLSRLETINVLPRVGIVDEETQYLRGKRCPDRNLLATSEALHFFLLGMGWNDTPLIEAMIDAFDGRKGTLP